MTTYFPRPLGLVAIAALSAIAMFTLAACGDDAGADDDASSDVAVLAAISVMDGAGFHEIDDAIGQEGKIPATARTTTLRTETLLRLTTWPTPALQSQASALAQLMAELAAAIDGESPDMAVATEASRKVHVAQHEFSGAVWKYLYDVAGVTTEAPHGH